MKVVKVHCAAMLRVAAGVALAVLLSGCPATTPVVITPQEQASRVVYTCPNAKTLDVTKIQGQGSVILVVDGTTMQLARDASHQSAERYSNRIQTLTLYGNSAMFDSVGRSAYGPCVAQGAVPGASGDDGDGPRPRTRRTRDND